MSKQQLRVKTLSLYEIMEKYLDRESAVKCFQDILWGTDVVCVKCGCYSKITEQKKFGDYWCGDCRSYFNVFTNTPMERSKIDPGKWLYAAYTLLTSRKGISSLQLSKGD